MTKTFKDIFGQELSKEKEPYQEPVFMFTASSLRNACYAGWYSAFGDKEKAEKWVNSARFEWVSEVGVIKRIEPFRKNHDMWDYISEETMKRLVDQFLETIRTEIKKGKERVKAAEKPSK